MNEIGRQLRWVVSTIQINRYLVLIAIRYYILTSGTPNDPISTLDNKANCCTCKVLTAEDRMNRVDNEEEDRSGEVE